MRKRNLIILIIIILVISLSSYYLGKIRKESSSKESSLFEQESVATELSYEEIAHLTKEINNLSPQKASSEEGWQVIRIAVIDEENLYLTYGDGNLLRRILITKQDGKWKRIGYFEPGENLWHLISGKDPYQGKFEAIYEKNPETDEWEKR